MRRKSCTGPAIPQPTEAKPDTQKVLEALKQRVENLDAELCGIVSPSVDPLPARASGSKTSDQGAIGDASDAKITVRSGDGMDGGGDFTLNQEFPKTITLSHGLTTEQGSVGNSDQFFIQSIELDEFGHVVSITSAEATGGGVGNANDTQITLAAGSGILGGGDFTLNQNTPETITFAHDDTSGQPSVSNTGNNFIQSVELDGFGHVTSITSGSVTGSGSANDAQINLIAGTGVSGGGAFTTDQGFPDSISFSHADTSSQPSVNNSGNVFVQGIALDGFGHVTSITSAEAAGGGGNANDAQITLVAGSGLSGGGAFTVDQVSNEVIAFSHGDTSSQPSINGSDDTFIQDVTLDTYGHVTSLVQAAVPRFTHPANGNGYAFVRSDLVMEVGRYIDFHLNDESGDYSTRLDCRTEDRLALVGGEFSVGDYAVSPTLGFYAGSAGLMQVQTTSSAIEMRAGSGLPLRLTVSNNVTATGDVCAYSDRRIKENIGTISKALDLVSSMRGVRYDRRDTGEAGVGVIAQEIEKVLPEVVSKMGDEQGTLTVAYGNLAGVFIEAIKELADLVYEQGREIEELKDGLA